MDKGKVFPHFPIYSLPINPHSALGLSARCARILLPPSHEINLPMHSYLWLSHGCCLPRPRPDSQSCAWLPCSRNGRNVVPLRQQIWLCQASPAHRSGSRANPALSCAPHPSCSCSYCLAIVILWEGWCLHPCREMENARSTFHVEHTNHPMSSVCAMEAVTNPPKATD